MCERHPARAAFHEATNRPGLADVFLVPIGGFDEGAVRGEAHHGASGDDECVSRIGGARVDEDAGNSCGLVCDELAYVYGPFRVTMLANA